MFNDALDQKTTMLPWSNPRRIAASLKHTATLKQQGNAESFQVAMRLLHFYINRSERVLPANKKKVLEQVRFELRKLFNK